MPDRIQHPRSYRKRALVAFKVQILVSILCLATIWTFFITTPQCMDPKSCNGLHPPLVSAVSSFRIATKTTTTEKTKTNTKASRQYVPAPVEKYIMDHLRELGWYNEKNSEGCMIWNNASHPLYNDLQLYLHDLDTYQELVRHFPSVKSDLRELKRNASSAETFHTNVCDQVKLGGPQGVQGIFSRSGQLSHSSSGYVEPLTTPMRHPRFCLDPTFLMDMNYMVHDFEAMCHKIHPYSTTVLIDMGASLSFHQDQDNPLLDVDENPIVYLLQMYETFGIHFDHIYSFEAAFTHPDEVFEKLLPEKYMTSYHWINTGVDSEKNGKLNPLHSILRHFKEDDFVVIKLDIDTSTIELPLAKQLLDDDSLSKLVDQFYFEHHVHMKEMSRIWSSAMNGSLKDTFELFYGLRERGIPAHFWI